MGADSILFATAHRPWPAPMAPWIMTQRWNDLLFLHYPVAPEAIRPLVPDVLTLDTYKQRAWVTVTPFWINHLRPPGVPSLPVAVTFFRDQCANLRHLRRQAGHLFLQPRCQQLVGGLGSAGLLPSALLAGFHQGERARRAEDRICFEAAARTQAGRTSLLLRPRVRQISRTAGLDRALPHRALLPLCLQSQTALPWARFTICRGTCSQRRLKWSRTPWPSQRVCSFHPQPELVYFARELKVLFWAPERCGSVER